MKTRKLKDLKENECIKVNTLKEAKYLSKKILFGSALNKFKPHELHNLYIITANGCFYTCVDPSEAVLPASDFIKPKKPKKWKEAFQEIARLDGEVQELKEKLNPNWVQDIYDSMPIKDHEATEYLKKHSTDCRNLHVKEGVISGDKTITDMETGTEFTLEETSEPGTYNAIPKHIGSVVSKTELTELPEYWAIAVDRENSEAKSWFDTTFGRNVTWGDGFAHYPEVEEGVCTCSWFKPGYTVISQSDFERLVLKKDDNDTNVVNMEVGKWYKDTSVKGISLYLIFVTDVYDSGVGGYGFINGKWFTNSNSYSAQLISATNEEVEAALIAEAERRGFKEGVTVDITNLSDSYNPNMILRGKISFSEFKDNGYIWFGRQLIFDNGKWAEIIQTEEIDWSDIGLIVHDFDDWVMITGIHDEKTFKGVCLKTTTGSIIGDYFDAWPKERFIMFKGKITLSND